MPDDTSLQRSLLQDEKVPHRHGVGNASLIELVHAIVRGERCASQEVFEELRAPASSA